MSLPHLRISSIAVMTLLAAGCPAPDETDDSGQTNGSQTTEQTSQGPDTEGPTTEGPDTEGPTTEGPDTEGPDTEGPDTEGPDTEGPDTEGPDTEGPDTDGPDTEGPDTEGPDTEGETPPACADIPMEGLVGAVALRHADLPEPDPGDTDTGAESGGSGGGGSDIDPDTLIIELSSVESSCGDPSPSLPCGSHWNLSFSIPPELQEPGVYAVGYDFGTEITGVLFDTGEGSGEDCSFGGGTISGTLEIISITDTEVVGRFCDGDGLFVNPTGAFTATRCSS